MSSKSNAVQIPQDSPIASLQKSVFTNCQIEGTMFCYESKDRVAVRKRPITIVPPLTRYMASVWKRGMENTDACVRLRAVVDRCALYAGLLSMRVRHPHRFKMYYPAPFWTSSGKSRNCLLCVLSFCGSRRMPNSQLPLKRSLIALYRSIRTGIMT